MDSKVFCICQNLYGEKEWTLISDRYLPDRTISSISQRYWRLCLLIYKGQGIAIDSKGELKMPTKTVKSVDDFDEALIAKTLKPVAKPIEYGLYRWSMEEDIMLLKAVPLMGRLFAEIAKRLIPHRDRGALRKRYQVLERRVKGALKRDKKSSSDIVRKNVAPLMEAISKKGPLPITTGRILTKTPPIQVSQLQRYTQLSKQKTALPLPSSSKASLPGQSQYPIQTSPKTPQTQNSFNKRSSRIGQNMSSKQSMTSYSSYGLTQNSTGLVSTPMNLESPSKHDTSSRSGFEKIINGDYSHMSAVKHFIDDNDDRTKEALPSSTNQISRPVQFMDLPHFNLDNSCSGLSMLGSADKNLSNLDRNEDTISNRGTSILSSVLGRTKNTPSKTLPTQRSSVLSPMNFQGEHHQNQSQQHDQSMDSFNFSNLQSLHMKEESHHAFDKESVGLASLTTTPLQHSYSGTPNAFSHFPNAQASNLFHNNMTNNSLMVPQHEVDAAATLSQMSNSSANFPTDLLSSPSSPPDTRIYRSSLPPSSTEVTKPSQPSLSLFQKVKDRTKKSVE